MEFTLLLYYVSLHYIILYYIILYYIILYYIILYYIILYYIILYYTFTLPCAFMLCCLLCIGKYPLSSPCMEEHPAKPVRSARIQTSSHNSKTSWYSYQHPSIRRKCQTCLYEGWNFNSGNYLFTTDTK